MSGPRTYFAIDLKSYYASAECAARGLDRLTTNLVVADASPHRKDHLPGSFSLSQSLGDPRPGRGCSRWCRRSGRPTQPGCGQLSAAPRRREKGRQMSLAAPSYDAKALAADPSLEISYLVAPPRMAYYEKSPGKPTAST